MLWVLLQSGDDGASASERTRSPRRAASTLMRKVKLPASMTKWLRVVVLDVSSP